MWHKDGSAKVFLSVKLRPSTVGAALAVESCAVAVGLMLSSVVHFIAPLRHRRVVDPGLRDHRPGSAFLELNAADLRGGCTVWGSWCVS